MLLEKAKKITDEALEAIKNATNTDALYQAKVDYLGKQGALSKIMKETGKLPKEERPEFGQQVNHLKKTIESYYLKKEAELSKAELNEKLKSETLDLTLPGPNRSLGGPHPISLVIEEIVDILSRIGFSVRTGPMIESEFYNFEALNIPENHPARDMQDTFYMDEGHVLRTHTSPIQIHTMENEKPPLRVLAPGSVFRCDSDVTHSPNFYQIEGLCVDKKVSMADLKGTITYFVKAFFGQELKTRFRPSFFPFTEPSAEVDCSCPICKGKGCRVCSHTGWVEIGGCGLVNPKVLVHAKINGPQKTDEDYQGYAFGFGVERMAMIKYGIDDIRRFNENDIRFLSQFRR